MRQGFTLIEVVVSAVLIAVIGVSLIKLSSSNIEGVEYSREKRYDLFSLVLFQVSEFGHIKDYSGLEAEDIEIPEWKVESEEEEVMNIEFDLSQELVDGESPDLEITMGESTTEGEGLLSESETATESSEETGTEGELEEGVDGEENATKQTVTLTIYKEHIDIDGDGVDFYRLR